MPSIELHESGPDNVTTIQVPFTDAGKLAVVIRNFDELLCEYGAVDRRPKLQKSKTCSIIESKCILKKSLSNPTVLDNEQTPFGGQLTKSLTDLDVDDGAGFQRAFVTEICVEVGKAVEKRSGEKPPRKLKPNINHIENSTKSKNNFLTGNGTLKPLSTSAESSKSKHTNNNLNGLENMELLKSSTNNGASKQSDTKRWMIPTKSKPSINLNHMSERYLDSTKSSLTKQPVSRKNSFNLKDIETGKSSSTSKQTPGNRSGSTKPVLKRSPFITEIKIDDVKPSQDLSKLKQPNGRSTPKLKSSFAVKVDFGKRPGKLAPNVKTPFRTEAEKISKVQNEEDFPSTKISKSKSLWSVKNDTKLNDLLDKNSINAEPKDLTNKLSKSKSLWNVRNDPKVLKPNDLVGIKNDVRSSKVSGSFNGSVGKLKKLPDIQPKRLSKSKSLWSVKNGASLSKFNEIRDNTGSEDSVLVSYEGEKLLGMSTDLSNTPTRRLSKSKSLWSVRNDTNLSKMIENEVEGSSSNVEIKISKDLYNVESTKLSKSRSLWNVNNDLTPTKSSEKLPLTRQSTNLSRLLKAKSSWDVSSSSRSKIPTKIPTKSLPFVLHKFQSPSIPAGLNEILDRRQPESMKDLEELEQKVIQQEKMLMEAATLPTSLVRDVVRKLEQKRHNNNELKMALETTDPITFFTCGNLKKLTCANQASIQIENYDQRVEQQTGFVDIKNDGCVKSNFTTVVRNEKNRDYNSDCSDDSGNISNDLDLDCEVEEQTMEYTKPVAPKNTEVKPQFRSEIFFRAGVLGQLEARRDERLQGRVIALQAHCRGYLARRRLAHRRLQDVAVRCIQRNVRKFMSVRDWPWWRLLMRVTPLLNVHRTEEQLRIKTEELETLRSKLEKLESERSTLKLDNDKLEAKLSEMTADLADEHSTSTLAAERLDAETQERIRLERELTDSQNKNKTLQQSSERMEMELLCARADLNGLNSEEDDEGDPDGGVYKQRYERAARELEFTRRRLQQQHEDDLEQLVGLKKQLEKKLADAYEEVEEQRQVVGQWKRKVQKLNAETNDLRLLLEEQNSRNNLLEKKQRKFDAEAQLVHDELRQEKQGRERLSREKEIVIAEKYALENNLADTKLELDLQTEKLHALQREMDEITFGGKTEEEVTLLRKQKLDCERKLHEQEEELDELAGQVQLLEQTKLRLEMSLEQARKESKREATQRDDELEEVRCNAQKKVKALESQLETEHEERTLLLREKHELERRLVAVHEAERSERAGDEALLQRLKRDLRRTKALLRDAQTMLERQKADNPGKAVLRQLRHQLEDAECARVTAVKARQTAEVELSEAQAQVEEMQRQRAETEERASQASRERAELRTQLEENEEELAEVLKKYKAAVQQMSVDQLALQEQVSLVMELESERNSLKEQLMELNTKLESMESLGDTTSNLIAKRMELRLKEVESKLELEQTTRSRLEVQIARLKETVDKLQTECATSRTKEQQAQDTIRRLQRSLREQRDENAATSVRDAECLQRKKELEKKLETAEAETNATKADLRLALKRIEDLQSAIQGDLEDTISDNSDSDQDSFSSDESIGTFLANHKLSSSRSSDRNSLKSETSPH